ncbi:MAG: YdcF family protein [Nitrospinae bacterium]|nr:YdcF family protein [Nitrospinota bacterium]
MLKNENIICISSIDWDFIWQGHQEIMSTFARNGNRVLFIENTGVRTPNIRDIPRLKKRIINWFKTTKGFKNEMENLYVYSPIGLPFPYSRIAKWINKYLLLIPIKRWMKAMEFYEPIVWTFLPTGTALDIIEGLDKKLLIYYCIADFEKLSDKPEKVAKTENILIKKCDVIFAQGETLKQKCRKFNDNVMIFPFGVSFELFENFKTSLNGTPEDIKKIKKPIIGYIGGIHRHIDFKLIRYIAENRPDWSLALIGPVQTDVSEIKDLENVFLLGKKDFDRLPGYIDGFDVCMIPYNLTEYTETVYPTKMNEYHALGKPVVSTDLPEVNKFNKDNGNLVAIGKTYEEFVKHILDILGNAKTDNFIKERMESSRQNSWRERIEQMSNIMESAIKKKYETSPLNWQERFVSIYRHSRNRVSKIAITFAVLYVLIFYSPFVWYIAEPLKIIQQPIKADAIVVFGGGAGESGVPGQGYEERVTHAVDLFKKGYAEHIIFSSGYTNVMREPDVMKALAISLGVPYDSIITDVNSSNTYKNAINVKEILKEKGWNKVLLVSSPYHMRRVSLVFSKNAKDIDVVYTPTPNSQFYSYDIDSESGYFFRRTTIKQLEGFKHEYLGIIYYWWKGYI